MVKTDFYEVLGVSKTADGKEIKKAYRKIAMKYHPDRNPGDKAAEDKFKEAAEAYEVLSDADKRARYDRFGHDGVNSQFGGRGGGATMEDIFSQFGDIFGNQGSPFDSFFGGSTGRGRNTSGQRGSNLRIKAALTLEEIANGVSKKIKVKKQASCSTCGGSGAKDSSSVKTCGTCGGSGYVRQVKQTFLGAMQTTTPCPNCAGTGKTVTENCKDCSGAGRKQEEKPHENFTRNGQNIIYDLFVNFADAALRTSVEVPTLTGKVKIKVPPGTQGGKIFRLRGKGIPSIQGYGKGDQLIHVNIWTPKNLSTAERSYLEKMRDMSGFQPNPVKGEKGFFEKMKDYFG